MYIVVLQVAQREIFLISIVIHFDIVNQSQADVPLFTQPFIAFTAPSGLSYTFTVSRSTPVDESFVNIAF